MSQESCNRCRSFRREEFTRRCRSQCAFTGVCKRCWKQFRKSRRRIERLHAEETTRTKILGRAHRQSSHGQRQFSPIQTNLLNTRKQRQTSSLNKKRDCWIRASSRNSNRRSRKPKRRRSATVRLIYIRAAARMPQILSTNTKVCRERANSRPLLTSEQR